MPKKPKPLLKKSTDQKKQIHLEVLQKVTDLMTAGLGLVAALAWNEAIKAFFNTFFPTPSGNFIGLTLYALFITIIIVIITIQLGRAVNLAKKQAEKRKT